MTVTHFLLDVFLLSAIEEMGRAGEGMERSALALCYVALYLDEGAPPAPPPATTPCGRTCAWPC